MAQARAIYVLLAAVIAPPLAPAAEYVVATTGSDLAAGIADAPWRTLQHAADVVGPGDRVTVRPGNYVGFYLDTSGTPAAPIEFVAEPGVLISQPNDTTDDGINLEGASHIVIDGFGVTGMPRAGVRSVGFPDDLAKFVTIRNVTAGNNGVWGIFTGHVDDLVIEDNLASGSLDEHGIYVSNSGDRPVIRNNVIWNNHGSGIHMNGDLSQGGDGIISGALVSGNIIYNNALPIGMELGGGSGINMDGVQDSRIENNLLYNNHASGISLYSIDAAEGSTGNVVVNNTIHQPTDGRWALNIQDGGTNNTAFNNILVSEHPFRGAIDVSADSLTGFSSDYNVVISRFTTDGGDTVNLLGEWRIETGNDLHSLVADADENLLFVNPDPDVGDYHLLATALARDVGIATAAPAFDLEGKPRPIGAALDVGAYEFGIAGDYNQNGTVDAADYTVWRDGLGTTFTPADYDLWKSHFGQSPGSGSGVSAVTTAPEPSLLVLWSSVLAILSAIRRVRRRGTSERCAADTPRPDSLGA